ncbi:MAG: Ig-like domain repeat protein [Acidimicrobiales bacterium]|nr:Ig-like domain repeat protein [Acidimicrobiales bacterium]
MHPDTNPGNGYVQIRFNQAFTSWLDVYDRSGPVDVGEPVVVQASLVTASGADWDSRAGTITWKVGGDVVGTQVLENSADPFPIPGLGAGTHTVVAEFTPRYPADLEPSTGSVEVQVNQGRAALVISSGPNPSVTGQPVTLSATAAAIAPAPGTPSGEVQFMADGAPLGVPVALDPAGQASLTTDELAVGVRSISATYNGDATFLPATSAPLTHVVNTGDVAMTVAPAPSPSVVNETVTFTATMEAVRPASGVPGGTVTFTIDGIDLPPATVAADGTAGTSVSYLAAGNHDVIATYSGDASFNPAAAATTHAVNKGDVSVALTQSAPTSSSGEAVDFTAVVEPQIDGVAPTGVVHFYVGGSFVGAAELSAGGVATLSTSALAVGVNQITARYEGDRVWSETFANLVEHTVTDGSAPGTDPGGEPGSEDPGEDPGEGTDTSPTDPTDPDGGDVDPDDPSDGDADPGDGHLDDLDDLGDRQDPDGDVLGDGDGHAAGDGDPARPLARTGTAVLASTLGGLVIAAGGFLLMAAGRRRREA